jgi:hypothetical protein
MLVFQFFPNKKDIQQNVCKMQNAKKKTRLTRVGKLKI